MSFTAAVVAPSFQRIFFLHTQSSKLRTYLKQKLNFNFYGNPNLIRRFPSFIDRWSLFKQESNFFGKKALIRASIFNSAGWLIMTAERLPPMKLIVRLMNQDDLLLVMDVSCSVCQNGFRLNEESVFTECRHVYHRNCVDRWFQEVRL